MYGNLLIVAIVRNSFENKYLNTALTEKNGAPIE